MGVGAGVGVGVGGAVGVGAGVGAWVAVVVGTSVGRAVATGMVVGAIVGVAVAAGPDPPSQAATDETIATHTAPTVAMRPALLNMTGIIPEEANRFTGAGFNSAFGLVG